MAYSQPGPAAVDLAEAVIHHGRLVETLVDLGWTSETHFQSQTALLWCIHRYHAFLELMAANPQTSHVPTIVRIAHHFDRYLADEARLGYRELSFLVSSPPMAPSHPR